MRLVRIGKFITEHDDFHWLIDGLLPSEGWTLLFGPAKIGKSIFSLQLCKALSTGEPFLGYKIKQQLPIMYIQADVSSVGWRKVIKDYARECSGDYTVVDVPQKALGSEKAVGDLGKYIELCKPGFVVFDSFYNLASINFNSEQALVPIDTMNRLTTVEKNGVPTRIPWLLVHHPPQDAERPSGHNSIMAACSNIWGLFKRGKYYVFDLQRSRYREPEVIPMDKEKNGLWTRRKDDGNTGRYAQLNAY